MGDWATARLDSGAEQPGRSVVASAPALGAGDRRFESCRPDRPLGVRPGCATMTTVT
jgi:hypothetical protein